MTEAQVSNQKVVLERGAAGRYEYKIQGSDVIQKNLETGSEVRFDYWIFSCDPKGDAPKNIQQIATNGSDVFVLTNDKGSKNLWKVDASELNAGKGLLRHVELTAPHNGGAVKDISKLALLRGSLVLYGHVTSITKELPIFGFEKLPVGFLRYEMACGHT